MAEKLQPVRGTHDLLPDEFEKFHAVVTRARELATLYGFREMATPIFEMTEVFKRSMGDTSDVVSKEMFDFLTKGGESVCLRPEFTAGIARAFISNGMQQNLPLKLFSTGPLFRYERPQKGRQRQFHQVNFEWLGDDSAEADIEIIMLAGQLLHTLSGKKGCTLLINTLGDAESRAKYRRALVTYLTPHAIKLSEDSQRRLATNPLRILDSKSAEDKEVLKNAPRITEYLSEISAARFEKVRFALTAHIPYFQEVRVEPSLVRGLDYYTDTVFEFVANTGELGAQNTVLAGGRYDGLIEQMGGKPTPAIGFAAGVERLMLLVGDDPDARLGAVPRAYVCVLPLENITAEEMHLFGLNFRASIGNWMLSRSSQQRHTVEILWHGKLGKRMERASKLGATHILIIGGDEAKEGKCVLKDMHNGNQNLVDMLDFADPQKTAKIFDL